MNAKQLLQLGKQTLIEKGWTQGVFARDIFDQPIQSTSSDAVCYCMVGSMRSHMNDPGTNVDDELLFTAIQSLEKYCGHVPSYNDHSRRILVEVLEVFDKAIADCKY